MPRDLHRSSPPSRTTDEVRSGIPVALPARTRDELEAVAEWRPRRGPSMSQYPETTPSRVRSLPRRRRKPLRLSMEALEDRQMLDASLPELVVGRVLSAY